MRVKISSFTPLFFPYTARYASVFSNVTFIQGFIPSKWTIKILNLLDFILKSNISKKALRRLPDNFKGKNIGIALPEIVMAVGLAVLKNKPMVEFHSHTFYGWRSKYYLNNLDIFHVRSGSGRGGAIQTAKKNGAIVVTDHSIAHPKTMEAILLDEYEKYKIPFEFSNRFWDIITEDCKEADYVLVNSDYVKDTFIENGYDKNKIKVIYLGVREDFWSCKTKYETSEVLNLLFIGGFGFRKGCEYLLKSLELIQKKGIKFTLTVIGPIVDFETVIGKYNTDCVDFKGRVLYDDLKNYYATSDIFIFPSLCEGSTMAGMEAMSAGMPCIFTDNCGVPVVDRENGLIIPIKDEQAIADAVEVLYTNESLRKKLGVQAAATIKDKYKWSDYQTNLNSFYKEIMQPLN
jgi:glycosyltransferase involved in cell wall biosynthesis